ncbi:hypothetical protein Nepgr_028144 [Nepenthes gracilis]|uniref:Uncharacterized protein n=1 Tax=Nepenthes gracilis TaxID=150966 RepID=A0AAD3TCK8_NEPGR|nr:hypothetical protein Nepgr_028144 [Nepenthes gracilis]
MVSEQVDEKKRLEMEVPPEIRLRMEEAQHQAVLHPRCPLQDRLRFRSHLPRLHYLCLLSLLWLSLLTNHSPTLRSQSLPSYSESDLDWLMVVVDAGMRSISG